MFWRLNYESSTNLIEIKRTGNQKVIYKQKDILSKSTSVHLPLFAVSMILIITDLSLYLLMFEGDNYV